MRQQSSGQGSEYKLGKGKAIITRTDEIGRITRVNPDFKQASGYECHELMGHPHNVVRHSFMPAEAFRDLWKTIQSGKFWRGLVKNRRKNGDYYWVKATVTPVEDGYLSFRTRPDQTEIDAATELYESIQQGQKVEFDQGRVVPAGLKGTFWRIKHRLISLPINSKVFWPMLLMWVVLFGLVWQQGESLKQQVISEVGQIAVASSNENENDQNTRIYNQDILPATQAVESQAVDLGRPHESSIKHQTLPLSSLTSTIEQALLWLKILLVVVGLISLIAIWRLATWLSQRLEQSVQVAERMCVGDLNFDTPVMDADESGRLMNALTAMQNRLRELIYDLGYDAKHLSDAAKHLDTQSSQLAEAANNQKQSTEQVAGTVEQLTTAMQQISDQADTVEGLAQDSVAAAMLSARTVHEAADGINRMAEEVFTATQSLEMLKSMSKEVNGIVATIEDIAEQTNLLALNAAIEAARAGEHGRGFAVVADEVRKLSQRTAQSTSEISSVIGKIQAMVDKVDTDMITGVKNMKQGVDLAHKAGDAVSGLEEKARLVSSSAAHIRQCLKEHQSGMVVIAERVEQIAQASVQVAVGNQEVVKSVDRLYQMAGDVHNYSKQFKVV